MPQPNKSPVFLFEKGKNNAYASPPINAINGYSTCIDDRMYSNPACLYIHENPLPNIYSYNRGLSLLMKNLLNPTDYESLVHRINTVSSTSERSWGKMEVNQMIIHLKDQLDIALGNMSAAAQGPLLFHTIFGRFFALYIVPWRKGKESTPREMNADFKGMVVTDFENDKHLLLIRMKEFTTATSFAAHPFFGNLNRKDWGRLAWKHINHHLSQFGA